MTGPGGDAIVLGFPCCREPAQRMARAAGLDYGDVHIHTFPDGESLVRLPERVPRHAIFYLALDHPNARLVDLVLAAGAAPGLGAERLTLVAPYLCYMRQDIAFRPGEAVSQRIVGELLARHFDTVITVDPHLHRTHDLGDAVPVRRAVALTARDAMADWLAKRGGNPLLMGPDAESEQWVGAIAARAGFDYGVAAKVRTGDRDVSIALPDLDVDGRDIVLVDDVVSSGQTLAEAARQLSARGAMSIAALATHALFVDDALQRMKAAGIGEIVSSDSITHPTNGIELAALLAGAL